MDIQYWEREDYMEAVKQYSYYNQLSQALNPFNSNDQWAFNQRDKYAEQMNAIKKLCT